MALVEVQNLAIRFPIFGADQRSLKRRIGGAVGGRLRGSGSAAPNVVQALNNITFTLTSGDRLGLVGHNGAGKTTLLRAIAGAYYPDEGSVLVEGRVSSLLEPMLGMDPFVTGMENIRLRGLMMGLTGRDIAQRTERIAEFTGLGPYLGMPLKTYSQGMIARLAFAVSTAVDADVLLMDEWLGVGDAAFRQQAEIRLMGLLANSKIVILASHDMGLMRSLCNKFIRLDAGEATPVMTVEEFDRLQDAS